jgi:hypothetical protein
MAGIVAPTNHEVNFGCVRLFGDKLPLSNEPSPWPISVYHLIDPMFSRT